MAGCITLKAAAANLAPMIQTFFEQSRCSGDKVVNLSSGLTEDDFVAFILIAIGNFLHEENYEKHPQWLRSREFFKTMTMTITIKLESLSSLGDLFVGNIVSLICFHSLWVIQKVSIFNRRCLFYKEISERLSPPRSIFHIAPPLLFFYSWSKFASLRLQFFLKMPWVVISDLPSLPSLHH